jgi:hypothetical protein
MALSAHCCWCCSVCPRGDVKPPGGGDGWRRGGRKRGLDSVMTRLSTVVTEAAERLGVLLTPRNLLQDETEKTTLLHGLIEVLLPTISGMEECVKCCDHCYKNGTQRLDDPQFLIQSINKACGEMVARLPDAGKPAAAAAAAAAAAPPSPALSPVAEMVGEAEPKRKRAGLGERDANAQDASPAAPPQLDRAGDENDSSVAAVQQQQKLKVAAQHAKSKEKKRREKYQATAAVREEQNSDRVWAAAASI